MTLSNICHPVYYGGLAYEGGILALTILSRMKGPSLAAIKNFKLQQEQKKRHEEERKVQEKLTTLEHRAAQGDKKAKTQLKKIEKVKEEKVKQTDIDQARQRVQNASKFTTRSGSLDNGNKSKVSTQHKPVKVETNFEELMKLAKNNTNEIKSKKRLKGCSQKDDVKRGESLNRAPSASIVDREVSRKQIQTNSRADRPYCGPSTSSSKSAQRPVVQQPQTTYQRSRITNHQQVMTKHGTRPPPPQTRAVISNRYRDDDDYDDEDEDEYESDGFVVNDGDDEVQEELDKTIKSVFRYDRRRCDLREQALDREYRAIGRVSTFEDLEREERRASRLAAAEDARALRDEEERKRLKKIRLKGMRD